MNYRGYEILDFSGLAESDQLARLIKFQQQVIDGVLAGGGGGGLPETPLAVAHGGTEATTAASARTSLGLGTAATHATTDYDAAGAAAAAQAASLPVAGTAADSAKLGGVAAAGYDLTNSTKTASQISDATAVTRSVLTGTPAPVQAEAYGFATGASASANATALAAALAASDWVTITTPGTYTVTGTANAQAISLTSNKHIRLGRGVTIKLAANSNCDLIRNSDWVNGNSNITIEGGTFDFNGNVGTPAGDGTWTTSATNQNGQDSWPNWRGNGMTFVRVAGFTMRNCTIKNHLYYGVMLYRCSGLRLADNRILGGKDGFHIQLPVNDAVIDGTNGFTADDFIAFTSPMLSQSDLPTPTQLGDVGKGSGGSPTDPTNYTADDLFKGDSDNIRVTNTALESKSLGIAFLNAPNWKYRRLRVDGLTGSALGVGVRAIDDGAAYTGGTFDVLDITRMTLSNCTAGVQCTYTTGGRLIVHDALWRAPSNAVGSIILLSSAQLDALTLDNITIDADTNFNADVITLTDSGVADYKVTRLTVLNRSSTGGSSFILMQFDSSVAKTIGKLQISDVSINGLVGSVHVLKFSANYTLSTPIQISNFNFVGSGSTTFMQTLSNVTVHLQNVYVKDAYGLFYSSGSSNIDVTAANLVYSGLSVAPIFTSGTKALRWAVSPVNALAIATGHVAVDATLGNNFTLSASASFTLDKPTGAYNGQDLRFLITQASGGSHTITLATGIVLPSGQTVTLTTTDAHSDLLILHYDAAADKFIVTAFIEDYTL